MKKLILLMLIVSSAFAYNDIPVEIEEITTVKGNGNSGGTRH